MKRFVTFLCLHSFVLPAFAAAPFQDAAVCWSMADAGSLTVHGDVKLGVELTGAERAASLARGGDGKVAQFGGGHLEIGGPAFDPPGAEFTLLLRVRDPQGEWNAPLFGSYGGDGKASLYLRGVDGATLPHEDRNFTGGKVSTPAGWMFGAPEGPRAVHGSRGVVEFLWGATNLPVPFEKRRMLPKKFPDGEIPALFTDASNAVLRVMFPAELLGPRDWHDVIVRGTGAKLQLWIDGVLLDEEFPIGTTRPATAPRFFGAAQTADGKLLSGFRGQMDHAALWHRALSEAEIAALSGGTERVRQRELAILGDESASMQYFRARGHNRKAGDCIPYWDERSGTFRLFYLILRRNMHSKWDGGHGGLEIWQASTKDLKTWTHHPVTIPITEQWEAWNGTGAVAFHNGQYNWFYPTPDYYSDHGGVQRAVSKDGVTFTKTTPHPFLPGGDVEIFQTEDGLSHLIKAGPQQRAKTKPLRNKTLVAWVRCADLNQQGGSVLTIEHSDATQFDGIVFGEIASRRWMPGSDRHQRTPRDQNGWAGETSKPDGVVQVAIVYDGAKGALYRNGALYAAYPIKDHVVFPPGSSLLMGLRHTTATADRAFFHGRILDARVYNTALKPDQLAALKPDAEGGPKPVAWYDFESGSLRDRTGTFPDAMLHGNARVENGELVVGDGDYLKVPGAFYTQVRLTSPDLEKWTEQPGTFIASDKQLATCPHVFKFGAWHYYICGNGVWKSKGWFGPWTENTPLRLDNLAVPKTGPFGNERRIYAGFLPDDGWGGNEVLRDLVQESDGNLGTRFVNEMIPATAAPLAVQNSVRVKAAEKFELPKIPQDYRLQMEVAPEAGATSFGVSLRADASDGCELAFHPAAKRVSFSAMSGSSGKTGGGPAIEAVRGLDKPFTLDIIVRHDILDAEIGGRRSLVTRFWNPAGDRLRFFAEGGAVTFRNIRVSPLKETYKPYPACQPPANPQALNFHLMHPGGESLPGDPNAAFCLDGIYHLHYILAHPWQGKKSFAFVHVTSPDMLHWTWQTTKLQPSFTGHGMFSGTGFITKEGKPAAIYHGQASGRNQIAIAKDRRLTAWEKPYPVEVKNADGTEAKIRHWDPDCFLIGDTYYAISGGVNPPLFKSKDLKNWMLVGDFLRHDLPDVVHGEDISCGNFFPIGNKWMLLCISHPLGCRYYVGDWDAKAEQFVPQKHGRMNWRREDQSLFGPPWRVDFFAPESLLTPDGRRVMWTWLASIGVNDGKMDNRTIQSLPRELSLPADGILRIKPLRELETLRHSPVTLSDIKVSETIRAVLPDRAPAGKKITTLAGDAVEMRITIARDEAARKLFGFTLFSDGKGGGLPIMFRPETGALRVGTTEAPFSIADLPVGEDVELRIFVDKYLVEVFANDRQALVASHADYRGKPDVTAFTVGAPTTIKKLELWRLTPTNQGFREAQANRVWEPDAK
jgi:sucrose-6-phosphate hydrolase SacC (GH32 family)